MQTTLSTTKSRRLGALHDVMVFCGVGLLCVFAPVAWSAPILFVADMDDLNDLDGNDSVVERLEALGHEVTAIDDDDAQLEDPTGQDLIVISSSVLSSKVGFHFSDEPIPVIHWEEALWDEYYMSDAGGRGVDGDSIEVVDTSHPLAGQMGLAGTGEVVIRDLLTLFHVGNEANLAPGAHVIAEEAGGHME